MGSVWRRPKLWLGLVLVLGLLGGCNRGAEVSDNPTETGAAGEIAPAPGTGSEAPAGELVDEGGFRSTPINPTRTAHLMTQATGSQINLRLQPTTQAEAKGYGLGGDQITLLRLAEGEGGFSWYFVKLAQSGAEGWVRGDFIDTSGQAASPAPGAAPDPAPGTNPDISTGPCGEANRPEAFFETKSFTIHLCQTPRGLSYIGINKASNETLATADVRLNQGTYIAINGNYQYHINDNSLTVYQVTSGSYNQLDNEAVLRHERFLY
jgi:hypothetical protein